MFSAEFIPQCSVRFLGAVINGIFKEIIWSVRLFRFPANVCILRICRLYPAVLFSSFVSSSELLYEILRIFCGTILSRTDRQHFFFLMFLA